MSKDLRELGKYKLLQPLGRGNMGEVWKAFDPQLKRYVAIKFLYADRRADPDIRMRFMREAQGAASLRHPNIVQVHEFHTSPTNPDEAYMVMDYIEGQTLRDYIQHTSRIQQFPSVDELVQLFTSICLAVDYAHQHRMIHRDIKPANILLDKHNTLRNPTGEPMLTDFGLVKMMDAATATKTGVTIGTPMYMSPEQGQGRPGNEYSDIYALGVILYEMCTGVPPFRAERDYAILAQHVTQEPTPPRLLNPHIPQALQVVILRCLAKDPAKRFPRATSLAAAIAEAVNVPVPKELGQPLYPADMMNHPTFHGLPDSPPSPPAIQRVPNPPSGGETVLSASLTQIPAVSPARTPAISSMPTARPEPPKPPDTHKRQRLRVAVIALLLFMLIISALGGAFMLLRPGSPSGATATNQAVGQASFFSSGALDSQGNAAASDGITVLLHGVPAPASGNSDYAWLLSKFGNVPPLLLGQMAFTQQGASLRFTDPQHRNLLSPAYQYTAFRITEQKATDPPSLEGGGTLRYQATLPTTASPKDGFSYLDHIHHLLSSDPELDALHLPGGVDFWLLKNVEEVQKAAKEVHDHADPNFVRQQVTNIVYYLHGPCASLDLKNAGAVPGTPGLENGLAHDAQISLLDCPQETNPPAYLSHLHIHLIGLQQSPGATPDQQRLAAQIEGYRNQATQWLKQVLTDALQLASMPNLTSPQALVLRSELDAHATLALVGQFDPGTRALEPGIALICNDVQFLASFEVTPAP